MSDWLLDSYTSSDLQEKEKGQQKWREKMRKKRKKKREKMRHRKRMTMTTSSDDFRSLVRKRRRFDDF